MDAAAIFKGVEAFVGTGGVLAITKLAQEFLASKREDRKDEKADDERKELMERNDKTNDRLLQAKQEALDSAKREADALERENKALRLLFGYRTLRDGLEATPDGDIRDRDAMLQVIGDLIPEAERESRAAVDGTPNVLVQETK